MPLTVDWSVTVDGVNVTSRWNPYVIDVEVEDRAGLTSHSARITFADDGRLIMPRKGAMLVVAILGVQVFRRKVESSRFTFARRDGGKLVVTAKGVDTEGKAKEGQHSQRRTQR